MKILHIKQIHILSFILVFFSCSFITETIAQNEYCSHEQQMTNAYNTDPFYEGIIESNNEIIQQGINEGGQALIDDETVYTIPVVVHVMHLGVNSNSNISDAQIQSGIDQLNSDFMNETEGYNVNIQFCLAKRDPFNISTNGIRRKDATGVTNYQNFGISIGDNEAELKSLSVWPNTDYVNIWIVDDIANDSPNGQALGYSTFPNTDAGIDGIVVQYSAFGNVTDSKVITHEMGHYFQLYHTFKDGAAGGCSENEPCDDDPTNDAEEDCCLNTGDRCCDTPSHEKTFGCPEQQPLGCNLAINDPIIYNHMSYTNNECKTQFTMDQGLRMRCALIEIRSDLLNSLGCVEACGPIESDFSIDNQVTAFNFKALNSNSGVKYEWHLNSISFGTLQSLYIDNSVLGFTFNVCLTVEEQGCLQRTCKTVINTINVSACPNDKVCEILDNGDLEIGTDDPFFHFQEYNRDYEVICSWYNYSRSPYYCNGDLNTGYMGMKAPGEKIGNYVELALIDGSDYVFTFQYYINKGRWNAPSNGEILQELYVAMAKDPFQSNSTIYNKIHRKYNLEVNNQAYLYDRNDVACMLNEVDFIEESFTFTYDASMGDYLVIGGESDIPVSINIDNISLLQCVGPCSPDLDIDYEGEGCSYLFNVLDAGVADLYSWAVNDQNGDVLMENGFQTGEEAFVVFPEAGTYTICVFATCGEGGSSKCITINVEEGCNLYCDFIIPITNGASCGFDSKTYSESIRIPKNFHLCPGNIDNLVDGEIVISVEVYTGNPNFNLLNLVLGENSVGNNIQIILCNETGGVECYNFQTFDEMGDCNSCNPLAPSIAQCDANNDPLDGISNYTGTFTIPSAVDELCGITSDIPGFSLQTPTNNVGSTEYTYTIDKDNSESFSGTVSICVIVGGVEVCTYVEISADGCDEYDCPQVLTLAGECSSVDENTGMASFSFTTIISLENQSSIDDLLSEYSICSQDDIFLEGGIINNVLITPLQGQKGYWIIGIMADIDCNKLIYGDVDHDLNILLCNAQGDEVCINFEIAFECDACKETDGGKRSINGYQDKSSIYPNPASNKVTIAIANKNIKKSYFYNLYNHLGMRVKSGNILNELNEIDLSKVMDGIYFMSIMENGLIIDNHKLILIK